MPPESTPTRDLDATSRATVAPGPSGGGAVAPAVAMLVAVLTIMATVVARTWWTTTLALVIEAAMLTIIGLYVWRVTTPTGADASADLANAEPAQDAFSAHDVPMGAPERGAVKAAYRRSHPAAVA